MRQGEVSQQNLMRTEVTDVGHLAGVRVEKDQVKAGQGRGGKTSTCSVSELLNWCILVEELTNTDGSPQRSVSVAQSQKRIR